MKNISKLLVFQLVLLGTVFLGFSQTTYTLKIEQQEQLKVYTGGDTTICFSRPIKLSGLATGGYPGYLYMWSPSDGLDDPTLKDPTANPDTTTTYTLRVIDSENCLATSEIIVFVDPCTGIKDISKAGNFEIYPNPNSGKFNFELNNIVGDNNLEIRIFNIYGQIVYHKKIRDDSFNQTMEIDIGNQLGGIYIMQVNSIKGIMFKRITLL